jgi:hypothetical protein
MRKTVLFGAALLLVCASVSMADEPKKPQQPSAEEKAAMEAMMKAATPGDMHKKMSVMIGTFDAKVTMYTPGQPPAESTATSESAWVLGGRFVEEKVSGTFMGMPFTGIGYTGYDNVKQEYIGTWMDNFGTQMMVSTGKASADGKTWDFTSSMSNPMTGKSDTVKEKVTVVDDDHHVMEMWGPGPDGKMYKMMEITYTRKKS